MCNSKCYDVISIVVSLIPVSYTHLARANDASVLEHGRRILVDRCEDQLLDHDG